MLAKDLGVSVPTLNLILRRRRAVTAEMALRLSRYFGTTARVWQNPAEPVRPRGSEPEDRQDRCSRHSTLDAGGSSRTHGLSLQTERDDATQRSTHD